MLLCGAANHGCRRLSAGAFLCFTLTGAVFCEATLHVPRRLGRTPPNAMTVAVVADDKVNLSAWWLEPAKPNGSCVVVLHGIVDPRVSAVGFAPMFLNAGYTVLLPDSRAHGASEGRFVTCGLFEKYDVIAWADWMKRAGCRKLYGMGESLGGLGVNTILPLEVADQGAAPQSSIAATKVGHAGARSQEPGARIERA